MLSRSLLPICREEMDTRGWDEVDFVLVTGDAYIDHPSFGAAVVARVLEAEGYRVGVAAQPSWKGPKDFTVFGRPRLAFLVSSGNLDSMVNKYTSFKKPRRGDVYSPGGKPGMRPDRALIPYTSRIRQAYKGVPVILGGLEASLRRLSHYDYWSNTIRRSVLLDAKADLLVYGMGEAPIIEVARRLSQGEGVEEIRNVRGTVYAAPPNEIEDNAETAAGGEWKKEGTLILPSYEDVKEGGQAFVESTRLRSEQIFPLTAKRIVEPHENRWVVQNPPAFPLSREELDKIYSLPFTREAHPSYESAGGVPALQEVLFSITSTRGCFGGCSFCSLSLHQGPIPVSRGKESIHREAVSFTRDPRFKGIIHDVGGPTANFLGPSCEKQREGAGCTHRSCLAPAVCPTLRADHSRFFNILRDLRSIPGIRRVFVRSGIRYDYLLEDKKGEEYIRELCEHHVSGQLKVAPEHSSERVLKRMRKPGIGSYLKFKNIFTRENRALGKKQFLIPYFISGHPGSSLREAVELALFLKKEGFIPDQVQDFYPTPGSLSTCMFVTGIDPQTGENVYVPRGEREKRMQRALLHFHKPENRTLVREALTEAGREDLIGRGKDCLISP